MPTISPLRNARIQRLLLDRIQTFHQAHYGVQDSELSQSVLRWMRESQKKQTAKENDMCNAAPLRQLLRMVRDYTEKHKPLAYILGSQPFGPLDLIVEPPVLIPRPETEHWALLLSQRFKEASSANAERRKRLRILDICSGTGCIGLLLAKELIHSWNIELHGMDVSSHAVDLARRNARLHDLDAVSTFHQADVFANADLEHLDLPSFDLVVSNPPYIPSSEMRELDRSVKEHESLLALEGVYPRSKGDQQVEHDGLDFYRRLKEIYTEHLASKPASDLPKVAVEVGKGQADVISEMFGKDRSRIVDDYAGIGRSVWIH